MMQIVIVSHYVLPHVGGIEVLADQLARGLVRDGHTVTMVASRGAAPREEMREGVRIVRVSAWNGLERRLHVPYPIFSPSLVWTLRRAMQGADVVHVHGVLYPGSLCGLAWARWLGKPLVVTEHVGFVPYSNGLLNWVQRAALAVTGRLFAHRADAVITYNSSVHRWFAQRSPRPERLFFVPNGVDTDVFRPPSPDERREARQCVGVPPNRKVILFVGRFVEKKGLDTMLQVRHADAEIVLCGSGDLPASLDPRVKVLRDVPHADMPRVYQAGDVLVLPSRGEGFPVAIMEALACGLPVVAARDPSYAAYVTPEEVLQADADPPSLTAAVREVLDDPAALARRRTAARARAVARFGLAETVRRHLTIYEEVVAARRSGR